MKINFLSPRKGLSTKEFTFDKIERVWKKTKSYRAGKFFDGISFEVENIDEAFQVIAKAQEKNSFMIHGDFINPSKLKNIIRRKRNDRDDGFQPTIKDRNVRFICFDVDGYKCDYSGQEAIEYFIASEMPTEFLVADYIYQFSASYALTSTALKCHLFFCLEKEASLTDLRNWVIATNSENDWGDILDPAVFVATQPIYTQRRICKGHADPIDDFCGLIKKSGNLSWSPPVSAAGKKTLKPSSFSESQFSFQKSVTKILTATSFHNEINSIALSLMNQGVTASQIKETIKGLMLAARGNIKDAARERTWRVRFDDIDRSVDSCFNLVNNPSTVDLTSWLKTAPKELIIKEYPGKCFKKSPEELKEIVEIIVARTGLGKREIKARLKKFDESNKATYNKKRRIEELKKKNIYEVIVNQHNLTAAATQIASILRQSKRLPPVFVQPSGLVYVDYDKNLTIRQMSKEKEYKARGKVYNRSASIVPFEKPYHDLIARLGLDIRFSKFEGSKEIDCPERLSSVVAMGKDSGHRELTGILECPYMTADWKIFNRDGYDPITGLYSIIDPKIEYKIIDPKQAYKYMIEEVLAEFPFADPLDGAVMVSSFLALMQRPLLAQDEAGMPSFGVTAPIQSSGKTSLVHLVTTAILNKSVPVSNFSSDEEELAKHILGLLREGHTCILFDNVEQGTDIKSETLAKAMSSDIFSNRLLGKNRTLKVPSSAIWFFTGNNITFSGDFATRVYTISLNPLMEDPDTRTFRRENIIDWVIDNKVKILSALLSILIGGKDDDQLETGSRFKIWDKYIRAPLYWASGIDINEAIFTNKQNDQDYILKKRLVGLIYEEFFEDDEESKLVTTRDIINRSRTKAITGETSELTAIGETLEDILNVKYASNAKSLGRLLSKMTDRAFGELILTREEKDRAFWKVQKINNIN